MSKTEIRIAGFGGQGVVLAGVLLGRAAAVYEGREVVQTQSYGAESRGGAARSEVILSDEPVIYPKVLEPDVLVAMSQPALDRYVKDLKPEGVLIIDADLVKHLPEDLGSGVGAQGFAVSAQPNGSGPRPLPHGYKLYAVPFSEIATKQLGKALVANMVMLGFLTAATRIVSAEAVREAVRTGVPKGTEGLNLRALEVGMERSVTLNH